MPPLEIGMVLTPTLARDRGYELVREHELGQVYKVNAGLHRPAFYVVIQDFVITTITLSLPLARAGLFTKSNP